MKAFDLVLSGLGGQGVMTLARIFAAAASREGIKVTLFEGTGLTQRGGSVFGFIRFGEHWSAKIRAHTADSIISLEFSEILNVIHFLKADGSVLINAGSVYDYYTKLNPDAYPSPTSIENIIKKHTSHFRIIPASQLAKESGSPQAVNMVMLGAMARNDLPVTFEGIKWAVEHTNAKFAAPNLNAFQKGVDFDIN